MKVSRTFTHLLSAGLLAMFATVGVSGIAMAQESFISTHFSVPEGKNEVPPVAGDAGYAVAVMKFDPASSSLQYRISVSLPAGQTITMAHFHRGAIGVTGDPIHTINFTAGSMTTTGVWSNIGSGDLAALMNREVYLNIHTNANQAGQLRDQVNLIPNLAAPDMRAAQEPSAPVGVETAKGDAFLYLDRTANRVIYAMDWDSLSGPPTMAHFHRGAVGVNGPPVHTIPIPANATNKGAMVGMWENLTQDDIADLRNARFYANIHTTQNPGGEVRGQVLTNDFYTAAVLPSNESEPVTGSNASGTGIATVLGGADLRALMIIDGTTTDPSMAHIHKGAKGTNGGIVFNLIGIGALGHPGVWLAFNNVVSTEDNAAFLSTGMYMNAHTTANPGGEARGQLIPAAGNLNSVTSSVPAAPVAGAMLSSWYEASSGLIHFRAENSKVSNDATVAVYSPLGTRVATLPVRDGQGTVQTTGMPTGVYFVQLLNGGTPVGVARVAVVR